MNKILLIIKREYLTRIKKRSFVIMTILGPLLMAAIIIVPIYIAQMSDEVKTIAVVDDSGLFYKRFADSENLKFVYLNNKIGEAKRDIDKSGYYALLYIPLDSNNAIVPTSFLLYSAKQPSLIIKSYLENLLQKDIESLKLAKSGVDEKVLASIYTKINITTIKLKTEGGKSSSAKNKISEERSYSELSYLLGFFAGLMIYFFIFMYGALVMRGVIEEKTSRIVEVIISSVKPLQLMFGKIIGVAAVGLTQFLLWIVLLASILFAVQQAFPVFSDKSKTEQYKAVSAKIPETNNINIQTKEDNGPSLKTVLDAINTINFPVMIISFILFFIGGYLLYGAMFAAIGGAVDNEADTQQFMLPITIPLLFSIIMQQFVINNPEGPVSFWMSMIPFTSPVIMMVRIPFGVPYWQLALSILILFLTFIAVSWLAAKVYRTGILMYGKKVSYKEIWKWIKYSA